MTIARWPWQRHLSDLATMMVLDVGEDISSVWTPTKGIVSEPTADLLLENGKAPVGSDTRPDPTLVEQKVRGLMDLVAVTDLDATPVFLPLGLTERIVSEERWSDLCTHLGGDPLVVQRPLAAAMNLDVLSGDSRAHLMIELDGRYAHVAVVLDGTVLVERLLQAGNYRHLETLVAELLAELENEYANDIRAEGAHVYGWAARRDLSRVLAALGLPLVRVGSGLTVLKGTCEMARKVFPWLS